MNRTATNTDVSRRTFLQTGAASLGALGLAGSADAGPPAMGLTIGFGAGDITPSPGMGIPGGFFAATGKGVRDNCWAVACVIHDGNTPIALVGTDTLFVGRPTVE